MIYKALVFEKYPEPGSNRHVRRHWCLRPTRLPVPPSGHLPNWDAKMFKDLILYNNNFEDFFTLL